MVVVAVDLVVDVLSALVAAAAAPRGEKADASDGECGC